MGLEAICRMGGISWNALEIGRLDKHVLNGLSGIGMDRGYRDDSSSSLGSFIQPWSQIGNCSTFSYGGKMVMMGWKFQFTTDIGVTWDV